MACSAMTSVSLAVATRVAQRSSGEGPSERNATRVGSPHSLATRPRRAALARRAKEEDEKEEEEEEEKEAGGEEGGNGREGREKEG